HRAPLGTHERFIAFLIEHFGGAFPTWMAPIQTRLIPVSEKFTEYAEQLKVEFESKLIRVDIDRSDESFNKKIRKAVTSKIPNMLILGGNEVENGTVTWRRYCVKEQQTLGRREYLAKIEAMIAQRTMDNFSDEALPEI
ncbi:MAG: hypothetical protein KDD66_14120, partial [Bdellovibrionales bacterium]|nr:hypothetical protein [Bdellovibrionales bacterium]